MYQIPLCAALEVELPTYWNTITKHLLYCRLFQQIEDWGRLSFSNMLPFERMHVLLKSFARSSKNMLVSISKNNHLYVMSENSDRFKQHRYANKPRHSNILVQQDVPEAKGNVTIKALNSHNGDKPPFLSKTGSRWYLSHLNPYIDTKSRVETEFNSAQRQKKFFY